MRDTELQQIWRRDARVLGEIGRGFADRDLPSIEVRLPRRLAEHAVAAWERDEGEGPVPPDTHEQRLQRHRAATLALVGLSIAEHGRWDGDEVAVELSPVFVGDAVQAADDLLSG
jgi:hypothetical protein